MPIIHVSVTGKQDVQKKAGLYGVCRQQHLQPHQHAAEEHLCVFPRDGAGKCTQDRTHSAHRLDHDPGSHQRGQKAIMGELTDELAKMTGENRSEIVIIFNDIPLPNAMLGGSPGQTTTTGKWTRYPLPPFGGGGCFFCAERRCCRRK